MNFRDILLQKVAEAAINLDEKQIEEFTVYYEFLTETNKVMNLTTLTEPEDVAVKHFIDSMFAYDKSMHNCSLADVGTGAGFPGVPIKILDPTVRVTLIDSLGKRLKFLDELILKLRLTGIQTKHIRAEDAGRDPALREQFDFVTARAVAKLNVLAEYCLPLVKTGGRFVAMKADVDGELTEAKKGIKILGGFVETVKSVQLPGLSDLRNLVIVRKIHNTPVKYPRRAGTAVKEPL